MSDEQDTGVQQSDVEEFGEWIKTKRFEARDVYRQQPRSENPRQTDMALGRYRAYSNVYDEFFQWWNEVKG